MRDISLLAVFTSFNILPVSGILQDDFTIGVAYSIHFPVTIKQDNPLICNMICHLNSNKMFDKSNNSIYLKNDNFTWCLSNVVVCRTLDEYAICCTVFLKTDVEMENSEKNIVHKGGLYTLQD